MFNSLSNLCGKISPGEQLQTAVSLISTQLPLFTHDTEVHRALMTTSHVAPVKPSSHICKTSTAHNNAKVLQAQDQLNAIPKCSSATISILWILKLPKNGRNVEF